MLAVRLGEIGKERLRPGEVARFEQGGLGADVAGGLGENLVEGAGGMADLQAQVPERIQDAVGKVFLEPGQPGGLGRGGVEEHHVDVAQRIQLAAAVAAQRDQADGRGRFAVLAAPRLHGVIEQGQQQPVHLPRDGGDDLPARIAPAVHFLDPRALHLQVDLARRQPLGRRAGAREGGREREGGRGGNGHGRGLHQQRNSLGESWKYPAEAGKHRIIFWLTDNSRLGYSAFSRGSSSVGRAPPCQGGRREFESLLPLQFQKPLFLSGFFVI